MKWDGMWQQGAAEGRQQQGRSTRLQGPAGVGAGCPLMLVGFHHVSSWPGLLVPLVGAEQRSFDVVYRNYEWDKEAKETTRNRHASSGTHPS